jgi:hypothetical protein
MANNLIKPEVTRRVKSFWDTKEGTTGMVVGAGVLGGLGWAAYKIMPYVANLMENTVLAIVFGAIAVGLVYALVIDGSLRRLLWLRYKLLMRALTYSVIKYDPAGVLRETQKLARMRLREADEYRTKARGQVELIRNTMDGYKREADTYLQEAQYLQSHHGSQSEIESRAMKLQELNAAYKELQLLYTVTQSWYEKMTHASETLETIISNTDFKINLETTKYNVASSTHNAWRMFKSAFSGSEDIEGLQNDTFAYMAEDYGQKVGEIESFMLDSKKFIDSADLRKAVNTENGMKLLEELSRRNLGIVEDEQPKLTTDAVSTVSYTDYLKKK